MRPCYMLFCWLMLWLPVIGCSSAVAAQVTNVQLYKQDQFYNLSADIDYQLSNAAKQALQNGVPLFWGIDIKAQQQRSYLWDKTLLTMSIRYRIQYHALLKMYRVRNEGTGEVFNFSTLAAALSLMSTLRDLPVVAQDRLASELQYQVAIKIVFDRDALPLPLRPIAYTNPQWFLSSDWTLWPLQK
ncbi:MAG: DUF4390 domain-containing protein [Methylococcales bacterium]